MTVLGYSGFTRDSHRSPDGRRGLGMTRLGFADMFGFRDGYPPFALFPLGYFGHDGAAAVIADGRIRACAAEERFTRVKHGLNLAGNPLLPRNAVAYCLSEAGRRVEEVEAVAHYCRFDPGAIRQRLALLRSTLAEPDRDLLAASYDAVYREMMTPEVVEDQFARLAGARPRRFVHVPHHRAHAASAYYPSGFDPALILTIDGTGEVDSSWLAVGEGRGITVVDRVPLPTSLGALYLIVTVYLGFRSLDDEYKVMGLAAYGDPERYRSFFDGMVLLEPEGRYSTVPLLEPGFEQRLVGALGAPRLRDEPIRQHHADVAAGLQAALERAVLHTLRHARRRTGLPRLCLAGGVALNCALNGAIARSGLFEDVFVQPASSDEGCSLGAALAVYHDAGGALDPDVERVYLGPAFGSDRVRRALERHAAELSWSESADPVDVAARALAEGAVVGWFQGRMEFGPRALGNRSILADPRDPGMKDRINAKVKHREPFRPFAPSVPAEQAGRFFDLAGLTASPHMLFALPVLPSARAAIPAVVHTDATARVQTVAPRDNPRFYALLERFGALTGVPVLLNTSFNVRNEPIVCTPEDAVRCFLKTDIDLLVIDAFVAHKRRAEPEPSRTVEAVQADAEPGP